MSFTEINVVGVYVAPIVPMLVAAWIVMVVLMATAKPGGH